MTTLWVLVILIPNAYSAIHIDGFSSKETCEIAAQIAQKPRAEGGLFLGSADVAVCLPRN